ncbi:hypothetical protein [Gimesia aquarii]|nr:hypothetical protein [Gimesia aquarii]
MKNRLSGHHNVFLLDGHMSRFSEGAGHWLGFAIGVDGTATERVLSCG